MADSHEPQAVTTGGIRYDSAFSAFHSDSKQPPGNSDGADTQPSAQDSAQAPANKPQSSATVSGTGASSSALQITYETSLTSYQSFEDTSAVAWPTANQRVAEIGGWRTYARRAYEDRKRQSREATEAESR